MQRYMFLKKGPFTNLTKFEKKLTETVGSGWKVNNFTSDNGEIIVLLERERS